MPRDAAVMFGGKNSCRQDLSVLLCFPPALEAWGWLCHGHCWAEEPLAPGKASTCGSGRHAAAGSSLRVLAKPLACSRSLTQLPVCVSWEDVRRWPSSRALSVPTLLPRPGLCEKAQPQAPSSLSLVQGGSGWSVASPGCWGLWGVPELLGTLGLAAWLVLCCQGRSSWPARPTRAGPLLLDGAPWLLVQAGLLFRSSTRVSVAFCVLSLPGKGLWCPGVGCGAGSDVSCHQPLQAVG